MICPRCKENAHGECLDRRRLENIRSGLIPLGRQADSEWCYCAHQPREQEES